MASNGPMRCFCGNVCVKRTSWTNLNPRRRFLGCQKYGEMGCCGYFSWYDPPMCERATAVIPGLLRKIRELEADNEAEKNAVRKMWITVMLSWFIMLAMWVATV